MTESVARMVDAACERAEKTLGVGFEQADGFRPWRAVDIEADIAIDTQERQRARAETVFGGEGFVCV